MGVSGPSLLIESTDSMMKYLDSQGSKYIEVFGPGGTILGGSIIFVTVLRLLSSFDDKCSSLFASLCSYNLYIY